MPHRKHVLVVDDEAPVAEAFRLFFESLGLRVSTASGGSEALGLLAVKPFDLVVTDLFMAHGEGTELIAELRRKGETPPIIVVTVDDAAVQRLNGFRNLQILFKPVDAEDILDAIDHALATPLQPISGV